MVCQQVSNKKLKRISNLKQSIENIVTVTLKTKNKWFVKILKEKLLLLVMVVNEYLTDETS